MYKKAFLFVVAVIGLTACSSMKNVVSQEDLAAYDSAKTVLELGVEAYVNNNFDEAIYYYQSIIELFPDESDSVSWAYYEIGWVHYKDGKTDKALEYFNQVLLIESDSAAPQILAAKMIENLS